MAMEYYYILGGLAVVIGAALALKGGSKWGWLIVAGGLGWIYYTFKHFGLLQ
jgi:hypothetical protein